MDKKYTKLVLEKLGLINSETDWLCELNDRGIYCEHSWSVQKKVFPKKDIDKAIQFCYDN